MRAEKVIEQNKTLLLTKPWAQLAEDEAALASMQDHIIDDYIMKCRWFAGKARKISFIKIQSLQTIPFDDTLAYLIVIHVGYTYGDEEKYAMPVSFVPDSYPLIEQLNPKAFIVRTIDGDVSGWMIDAIYDFRFQAQLFTNIWNNAVVPQVIGEIKYHRGKGLAATDEDMCHSCRIPELEQSNSSLIYGEKYFFKLYRKLFREINPEVEMLQFLTEVGGFL